MKDLALWSPGSSQPARLNHTRNIQACFFFDKDCSWPVRTFGILNWEACLFSDHRATRLIRNLLWHIYSKFPFSSYFLSQAASPLLFVLFSDWGTACADSAGPLQVVIIKLPSLFFLWGGVCLFVCFYVSAGLYFSLISKWFLASALGCWAL